MLMVGLLLSQLLPMFLDEGSYGELKHMVEVTLGICLAFIMINVGREFEIDKGNVRDYAKDYLVAMFAAAMPWLLIALYYIFAILPAGVRPPTPGYAGPVYINPKERRTP